MNTGLQLFQLQEIDTELMNAQYRIDEIDNDINNDTSISIAQEQLINVKEQIVVDSNEFNSINDEIRNKRNKISQSEMNFTMVL